MKTREAQRPRGLCYDAPVGLAGARRSSAPWCLGLFLTFLAAPICIPGPFGSRAAAEPGPTARVVLLGLDAADWLAIDPLVAAGRLPTFARLKAVGRTGILLATPPLISPIVWSTIATGQWPDDHGILDFMVDLPDGTQGPVGSSQRLVPAVWTLASDAGRRVGVVGWWATWPAEHVRGIVATDAIAPQLSRARLPVDAGLVHPPEAWPRVTRALVKPDAIGEEDLAAYVPITRQEYETARRALDGPPGALYRDKLAHLTSVVASTRTYAALAVDVARTERPDLLAVYLEGIDTLSHLFIRDARRGPRAIARAYQDADDLMKRLAEASSPDTLIVVCSDHGFYPPTAAVDEDPSNLAGPATAWHRPYGLVAVAEAGALTGRTASPVVPRPTQDLGIITALDIAPTVLHALGVAPTTDMGGHVVSAMLPVPIAQRPDVRVAAQPFTPSRPPARTAADREDAWARLRALGYVGAARTSLGRQNLGEVLYRRGRLAAAERELRAVVATQPSNLAAWLWLAKSLGGQGRPTEALAAYRSAIGLPGGAHDALVEAVDLAVSLGDLGAAQGLIDASGRAGDGEVARAVARGTMAEHRRRPQSAEREYRAALKAEPTSFEALSRLFDLLASEGRAAEATSEIARAAQLAPDSARHAALLGTARLAVGDAGAAQLALERALALAPDADPVRVALGRALLTEKKAGEAVAVLLPARPSVDRSVLLGAGYSSLGNWTLAVEQLQSALRAGRVTTDVLNGLGWAQLKLGRRGEAAESFRQSLATKPDQPEIRRLLAGLQPSFPR